MRVVYDTMVLLQNAVVPGRVHRTFSAVYDKSVTLCLSAELLAEVHDVMHRASIRSRFPALTPQVVDVFIADLISHGVSLPQVPRLFTWAHHPDDDHVFNLAIAANADRLVTWEERLLKISQTHPSESERLKLLAPNLRIVTPMELSSELAIKKHNET